VAGTAAPTVPRKGCSNTALACALDRGRAFLLASQNADGLWPYHPQKPGAPEPTCYALLAVGQEAAARERAIPAIARLVDSVANPAGKFELEWHRSLFLLALSRLGAAPELCRRLSQALLEITVRELNPEIKEFDPSLKGWGWVGGTASWVEPTSYALLALKCSGVRNHPRVQEAERLLLDRPCDDGGWNYGNRIVYGAKLTSNPPTTALAALALQGVPAASEQLKKALSFLRREASSQPSALSVSLAILALDAYRGPAGDLLQLLVRRQSNDGSWRGQIYPTALATLALQAIQERNNAFRIA